MVLGFLKKGPNSVGCYGKLPLHGDYISHASDGPEARFLSAWLDNGYRMTPGRDNPDAGEVGFVIGGRKRSLVGVFWPSGDASGTRRFPFALFVSVPSKPLVQYGDLVTLGVTPAVVSMAKAFPAIREAAAVDRIMHLVSGVQIPPLAAADAVTMEFSARAGESLSAAAALPVLFEAERFTDALGGAKKGGAPNFAVRIPLLTEFAPAAEAAAWMQILSHRLGDSGLAANGHVFVRRPKGSHPGELFLVHRELKPADLGFVLMPTDEYPYGNYLGDEVGSAEAAEFAQAVAEQHGSGFTLLDLVAAGTA
ncbi:MAG: TagF domain-containing protein [Planctomycetota bacterium]